MCLFSTAATRKQRVRLWCFKIYRGGGGVGVVSHGRDGNSSYYALIAAICNCQHDSAIPLQGTISIRIAAAAAETHSCSVLSYPFFAYATCIENFRCLDIYSSNPFKGSQRPYSFYSAPSMKPRFPRMNELRDNPSFPVTTFLD